MKQTLLEPLKNILSTAILPFWLRLRHSSSPYLHLIRLRHRSSSRSKWVKFRYRNYVFQRFLLFFRDEILRSAQDDSEVQDDSEAQDDNSATVRKTLWAKARRYAPLLQIVPFVRMVAVVNSLAMETAKETSDIDLFIVCKNGRLFIGRTLVTLLLHLLGVRRHGKKVAGRFCLSFFVSERALDLLNLQIQPSDPYLAHWVATVTPLFGKETYEQFLQKNSRWLPRYFQEPIAPRLFYARDSVFFKKIQRFFENIIDILGGGFLEKKLMAWQIPRAQKKAKALRIGEPAVVITEDILKFHDRDRRKEFVKKL